MASRQTSLVTGNYSWSTLASQLQDPALLNHLQTSSTDSQPNILLLLHPILIFTFNLFLTTFKILMQACIKIRGSYEVLMAVNVRLTECCEVTLQMEVGGPSELSTRTYTAFVP